MMRRESNPHNYYNQNYHPRQHRNSDLGQTPSSGGGGGGGGGVVGVLSRSSSKSSVENNDESERSYKTSSAWVPPNDRELIIRAKLKTGWSSRLSAQQQSALSSQAGAAAVSNHLLSNHNHLNSNNNNNNNINNHQARKDSMSVIGGMNLARQMSASRSGGFASTSPNNRSSSNAITSGSSSGSPSSGGGSVGSGGGVNQHMPITDAEFSEIEHVLKRANMVEQKELDRIGKLFQRYQAMNRPQGNGETTCFICNCNFGILGATPRICTDCLKNVCQTCSIDSLSLNKQSTIWLCRICAEYRDFLKKSGVWFSKRLPPVMAQNSGQTSTGMSPSNSNLSNSNSCKSDEMKIDANNNKTNAHFKSMNKPSVSKRKPSKNHIRNSNGGAESDNSGDECGDAVVIGGGDELTADANNNNNNNNPFIVTHSPPKKSSQNNNHRISRANRQRTRNGSTSRSSMHNHNRSDHEDDDEDDEDEQDENDNDIDDELDDGVGMSSPAAGRRANRIRSNSAALSSTSISQDQRMRETQNKSPVSTLSNEAHGHKSNEFEKFESEDMFKRDRSGDRQRQQSLTMLRQQASTGMMTSKLFNENLTNFDPNAESKLMADQIANTRHINNLSIANIANSTAISPSHGKPPFHPTLSAETNNINNNNNNKLTPAGHGGLKPNSLAVSASNVSSSHMIDDSTSNMSLAFNAYRPTRTPQSNLGHLQFTVEYIATQLQLKIDLIGATDLPSKDSNGLSDPYVKLHLLPGIAKATKLRSKTIYKNLNPHFNETFHYDGVTLQDLDTKTLRLTVLDEDKFGFDFIGEYRLPLKTLIINEVNHFNVALEEKLKNDDETDLTFRGKINFALKYSKQNSCLSVKINRCTQLLPMDNGKSSDPFVEISLLPSLKEGKSKFKTTVKKKTLDPEFFEEFKFQNVDLRNLLTRTIEICVWDKDFRKNDFIGLVQLGQNRTGDELKHFFTMIKNPELYHEQWHTLHLRSIDGSSDSL